VFSTCVGPQQQLPCKQCLLNCTVRGLPVKQPAQYAQKQGKGFAGLCSNSNLLACAEHSMLAEVPATRICISVLQHLPGFVTTLHTHHHHQAHSPRAQQSCSNLGRQSQAQGRDEVLQQRRVCLRHVPLVTLLQMVPDLDVLSIMIRAQ